MRSKANCCGSGRSTFAAVSVGDIPIKPAITGEWRLPGYPDAVVLQGRRFRRSTEWVWPYRGVAAQYREEVDRNAMHLLVHTDGSFSIDHMDEANPDRGLVLEHAIKDVAKTPVGLLVLTAGAAGLSIAAAVWLMGRRS